MKLATNRFGVQVTQPVAISYGAVLCSGIAGIIIALSGLDRATSLSLFLGNLFVIITSSLAVYWRKVYFLSIASVVGAMLSMFLPTLFTCFILTYYIFRSVPNKARSTDEESEAGYEEDEEVNTPPRRIKRQVYETPMYCVFCGERLCRDDGEATLDITSCPSCKHSIPPRFRPVTVRVDEAMQYCIRCGHFLERRDLTTMACRSCHARLPAA